MVCARCDQPILPDEEYRRVDHIAPTGPGHTVYVHKERCQAVPHQRYPTRPRGH
jgi:hypothetical protein